MFGRKKREETPREQPRDVRGRFAETSYSRADSVDLGDGPEAPPVFDSPEHQALKAEGVVAHQVLRTASRFEAVRLPEHASALDGAIAEASVTSLWLGRPRGPVAELLAEGAA